MKKINDLELFKYLDGECSSKEMKDIQQRLGQDPGLKMRYHELESMNNQLEQLSLEETSSKFSSRLISQLKTSKVFADEIPVTGAIYHTPWKYVLMCLVILAALVIIGREEYSLSGVLSFESGYFDFMMVSGERTWNLVQGLFTRYTLIVVTGIIMLFVVDRLILKPWFNYST